ncbi:hypothetical protein QBC44DRAFT_287708 [Cladorrhinum sp. PSN332]|nr:hypothetical protein QBC44DRAFT_287708 [Cladorrhinum sp. PSN332]
MALLSLLLLLFAVSTHVSASPVASHGLQRGRDVDEPTDDPPKLPTTLRPPIMPVITQVTATFATTLILNPRNAPSPVSEAVVAVPAEANRGCTTTYSPPRLGTAACQWSGTLTIYPTTTIQYKQLNCNGCDSLFISDYWYFCPNMQINKTERVDTPSTYWSTICRPTPARLRQRDEEAQNDAPATATSSGHGIAPTAEPVSNPVTTALPTPSVLPVANDLRVREGNQLEVCPTTHVVQPEQSAGKVSTKYSKTTTTTALLSCNGCSLVVTTAVAGYGPPVVFTTTTTLPVETVTAYACRP